MRTALKRYLLFLNYFFICNLSFHCEDNFTLDQNRTAPRLPPPTVTATPISEETQKLVRQILVNLPHEYRGILKFLWELHERKLVYDQAKAEYWARYYYPATANPTVTSDSTTMPPRVTTTQAAAVTSVPGATPNLAHTPSKLSALGDRLKTKLQTVFTPKSTANPSAPLRQNTVLQPTIATTTGHATTIAPDSELREQARRQAQYRAKGPDLTKFEIEAQLQHQERVNALIAAARTTKRVTRPRPETLPDTPGPTLYGPELSAKENLARYEQYQKIKQEQACKELLFPQLQVETPLSHALDLLAYGTEKNIPVSTPRPARPAGHPHQDYYCTYLHRNKKNRSMLLHR